MNDIPVNTVYRADCLFLLERMRSEQTALAYIDAPWSTGPARALGSPTEAETLQEYLMFLSRVLQQVWRVLGRSGSLFFHSEPHVAGHTRLLLDQVFGRSNFRTEIVWPRRRTPDARGLKTEHDSIFLYSKSDSFTYNSQRRPLSRDEVRSRYRLGDSLGRYRLMDLTSPVDRPNRQFEWDGTVPSPGRSWRHSREELARLDREGRIHYPSRGRAPRAKVYMEEGAGVEIGSLWDDIAPLSPSGPENLRYPGQRPRALLERIVRMGSHENDLVLDPFCGTGTALVAAQADGRRWLGCDLSPEACSFTAARLKDSLDLRRRQEVLVRDQGFVDRFPVIHGTYNSLVTGLEDASRRTFFLNKPLEVEETRHCEFKEVKGPSPVNPIRNLTDEYVVAFLNSEGGRIYWGIRDSDRMTVGVRLSYAQRDEIRRVVTEKLTKIRPAIAPTAYRIEFHQVFDEDPIPDLYVVEVVVPHVFTSNLHFTGKGDTFVKTDGGKKKLDGPEIQEEILRRVRR